MSRIETEYSELCLKIDELLSFVHVYLLKCIEKYFVQSSLKNQVAFR